jgi:hypothetical protein
MSRGAQQHQADKTQLGGQHLAISDGEKVRSDREADNEQPVRQSGERNNSHKQDTQRGETAHGDEQGMGGFVSVRRAKGECREPADGPQPQPRGKQVGSIIDPVRHAKRPFANSCMTAPRQRDQRQTIEHGSAGGLLAHQRGRRKQQAKAHQKGPADVRSARYRLNRWPCKVGQGLTHHGRDGHQHQGERHGRGAECGGGQQRSGKCSAHIAQPDGREGRGSEQPQQQRIVQRAQQGMKPVLHVRLLSGP